MFKTLERLGRVKPEKAVFIGCDLAREIAIANTSKMTTVRVMTGANRTSSSRVAEEKPTFEIDRLSDLLEALRSRV